MMIIMANEISISIPETDHLKLPQQLADYYPKAKTSAKRFTVPV